MKNVLIGSNHLGRRSDLLYKDIAATLRERIVAGEYAPGTKIPSLNDLVSEFAVSTITIRRALRELNYEGLLYGRQGLGVFVKPRRKIHRPLLGAPNSTIGDEIRRAGFNPEFKEIDLRKEKADGETAERLSLRRGTILYRHEKCIFVNGEVVSYHILHIPQNIINTLRSDLAHAFIFDLLKKNHIQYSKMRFEFGSGVVDQELAPIFNLRVGFPLLYVYYTPKSMDGVPIMSGVTICRSDMFIFEMDTSGSAVDARGTEM